MKSQNMDIRVLIEAALMIALAQILSFIPTNLGPFISVSLDMIPITLFALRHGFKKGTFVGLFYGLFKIIIGDAIFLSFVQGMIEYTIPYASIGLAGLFTNQLIHSIRRKKYQNAKINVVAATFLGIFVRYFWHFIAGVVYWGAYAPEGMSPVVYSLLVNGLHMVFTAIVVSLVFYFLISRSKGIFVASL